MITLTTEDLGEFRAIWWREFKEEISEAKAREEATRLLEFAFLVAKTPPEEKSTLPCRLE